MAVAPHTARFVRPHMSDVSPKINVLTIYSLTISFDHIFLSKHLWGSLSAFYNYPQRLNLGISFCLLHYPQDFHQLVKPPSLGASLGGEF